MKNLIKFIISILLGISVSIGLIYFFNYKVNKELESYLVHSNVLYQFNDISALCEGLLVTNPSEDNLNTCKPIINKVKVLTYKMENDYPYINFYKKYLK